MKIKRHGPDEPWSAEIACHGCESVLEVETGDVKYDVGGGYFERDPSYYVTCPVCGSTPTVKNPPRRVIAAVQAKRRGP